MCVLERKETERPNTTAQVPSLLNGCSSMKGRRKEGGENSRQSVCVSVLPSSFYSVTHRPLFHSPPAPVRTMMQGKAPSRLRVVLMMVMGQRDKGATVPVDAGRCADAHNADTDLKNGQNLLVFCVRFIGYQSLTLCFE